jgi:hypothetical protein
MENSKFIRFILGPIHFETRFLPLIKYNRETLDNHIFIVNNYELYKPYKEFTTILNVDDLRKNHLWSNEYEIIYDEIDPILHAKNYRDFCVKGDKLLPLNVLRFALLYCYENNILNVNYVSSNNFMTNNKECIKNYFDTNVPGTFAIPILGTLEPKPSWELSFIKNELTEKFPSLIIPDDFWRFDGHFFNCCFRNKEELLLFYELWDYIVYLMYIKCPDIIKLPTHGYTRLEQFIGIAMRIIEVNFNYNVIDFLTYWHQQTHGQHISLPHDSWYYTEGWGHCPKFSDVIHDDSIKTVRDAISKYKDGFKDYLDNTCTHLNYQINEDNIVLTHKNL